MSTTFDTTKLAQPTSTQRVLALFNRYRDAVQNWRNRTQLRAALYDLNDRELHDIGIARGEIEFAAASGAAGVDPRYVGPSGG
jgi:uncharacterized protein YjiS (DUF1127 family)